MRALPSFFYLGDWSDYVIELILLTIQAAFSTVHRFSIAPLSISAHFCTRSLKY